MEKYDRLLNEIKDYLNKEEINGENFKNEIISLYDLYNILNDELEGLRNITINSQINKKLNSLYYKYRFKNIFYGEIKADKNKSEIKIKDKSSCNPDNIFHNWYELTVFKDKNIDEIYFSDKKDNINKYLYVFIRKNYDLILETLTTAEYYVDLLGKLTYFTSTFSDDLFVVKLSINEKGEVIVNVEIKKEHELYDEFYKNWYKRENIYDFTNNHKEEILKRIPVLPYTLKEPFKNIYDLQNEKKSQKVKKLK